MKKILLNVFFIFSLLAPAYVYGQKDSAVMARLEAKYGWACYHDTNGGWYSVMAGGYNTKKGNEGACNLKGKEIIPPIYDDVYYYGTYYMVKKNGYVGIRDLNNTELLPCTRYTDVNWYQKEEYGGYCEVKIDKKVGVIDKNNKEVIPCKYDKTYVFSLKDKPFCTVVLNSLHGVYDINQRKEIIPCKYDVIYDSQLKDMDFCQVEKNGLVGLVSKTGRLIVPCIYTDMEDTSLKTNDYCVIVKGNKYGVLNKKGEEVVACQYGYLTLEQEINKVAFIQKDSEVKRWFYDDEHKYHPSEYEKKGKCGVLDLQTRKVIIPCKYVDIQTADKDLYTFNVGGSLPTSMQNEDHIYNKTEGGKWGCVDNKGRELIPAQYDAPILFKDGVAQVSKDGVVSLLPHPQSGSSLAIMNGISRSDVDDNIPQTGKRNSDTFAFIVANESYANLPTAVHAINDGRIFAEYCRKTLGLPENNVRYFENATYGNIVSTIKKVEDIANVYDGDATIIFYYVGLGTTDEQTKDRYVLPTDAALNAVSKTGYGVQEIIGRLDALNTKGTIIIFDAPFSGTDREGKTLNANRGVRLTPKIVTAQKNVLVCFSNTNDECSFASSKYGHGLFTYSLLKKLKESRGQCTWEEWLNSASTMVKKEAVSLFDKTQSPMMIVPIVKNSIVKSKF